MLFGIAAPVAEFCACAQKQGRLGARAGGHRTPQKQKGDILRGGTTPLNRDAHDAPRAVVPGRPRSSNANDAQLVAPATHVNAQFVETSEQYKEAMELSEATLQDEIRNTKDTQDHFYPARLFFDRDQYVFRPPHPQLYAIGMIVDPCGCMDAPDTCVPDCCVHRFGSAVYPWVKR